MPVVVHSSKGGTDETIQVIKAGAFDCLLEPYEEDDLLDVISQGLEAGRLMRSPVAISQPDMDTAGEAIIGRSKLIQEISKAIGRVAPTDATVLIRGASGTGKELVARAIYQHSARGGTMSWCCRQTSILGAAFPFGMRFAIWPDVV